MAKVTITVEDKDGSVDISVKAKPAFNLKDESKNTPAHFLGASVFDFLRKRGEELEAESADKYDPRDVALLGGDPSL